MDATNRMSRCEYVLFFIFPSVFMVANVFNENDVMCNTSVKGITVRKYILIYLRLLTKPVIRESVPKGA